MQYCAQTQQACLVAIPSLSRCQVEPARKMTFCLQQLHSSKPISISSSIPERKRQTDVCVTHAGLQQRHRSKPISMHSISNIVPESNFTAHWQTDVCITHAGLQQLHAATPISIHSINSNVSESRWRLDGCITCAGLCGAACTAAYMHNHKMQQVRTLKLLIYNDGIVDDQVAACGLGLLACSRSCCCSLLQNIHNCV